MSEIPVHSRPRRLADWINPTGAKKVHSLIDKVYQRKNLEMAWEMVKANRGSGGVDGQSLDGFAAQLDLQLDRLQSELKENVYRPQPVRQVQIPKAGKPGEFRMLGIPTIYDRVCQQALLNRLEPIFEPVFDEANFGYRRGRSTKDAMRKSMEGDSERSGVDCGRGPQGFLRVRGSHETANARCPKSSRWSGIAPDRGDAQGRKLWQRAAVSKRARDSARRGGFALAQ